LTAAPTPKKPNSSAFIQRRLEQIEKQKKSQGLEYDVLSPVVEYKPFLKLVLRLFKNYRMFDSYPREYELNNIVYRYIVKKMGLIEFFKKYYHSYEIFEQKIIEEIDLADYDLIHAHFAFPNGIIAKNLHLKYGTPYVLTLHGTDIHTLPYKSEQLKREIVESLENAFRCIFVSDFLRKEAVSLGYSGKNAIVIPNGFDSERFYFEDKDVAKKKLGIAKQKCIGFVGNLVPLKNVMILPEIFEKIKKEYENVDFVLIGDGELKEALQEKFAQKDINPLFTGTIDQKRVADYMRAMDVMILPSEKEGFGAVLIEAQACGTSCVGSDRGGIPEAIGNDDACFTIGEQFIDQISDYVLKMIKEGYDHQKMLKRAENYKWECLTESVIRLYKGEGCFKK